MANIRSMFMNNEPGWPVESGRPTCMSNLGAPIDNVPIYYTHVHVLINGEYGNSIFLDFGKCLAISQMLNSRG